jgi:hypothetical protein
MRGIRAIAMGIRTHSPAVNALFTNRALNLDHRPDPESRTANGRKVPSRVAIGSDSFAKFNPPARQLITECKDRTYRAQSRAVSRPSTSFWCRFEDKVSMSSMQFGGLSRGNAALKIIAVPSWRTLLVRSIHAAASPRASTWHWCR